eukprot:TRINITY_DN4265_c0_g2_i1.p1 TRINITY_DN4265_c0_g2~~TRINITY_DN4265_c0_g2_i1.p1  ORF type:complete len:478 (+),score=101.33 TRINITY_DN4265_c0_g2_i1:43-1476(+)
MRSIFTMQNAARPFCSFALSFLKGVSASAVSISHTRGRNLSFVGVRMYSIPQEVKRRKTRLLLQQQNKEKVEVRPFPIPKLQTPVFTEITPETIMRKPTASEKLFYSQVHTGKIQEALNTLHKFSEAGKDATSFVPTQECFHKLLLGLRGKGLTDDMEDVMNCMTSVGVKPSIVTHNILLSSFVDAEQYDKATKHYDYLKESNFAMTSVTFGIMMKIYRNNGDLKQMFQIIEDMQKAQVVPNAPVFNMLIDACGKAKQPARARSILDAMAALGSKPNMRSYTSLVAAYARNGDPVAAEGILNEMWNKDVIPNARAYTLVIDSYGRNKRPKDAYRVFREFQERSKHPADVELYTAVICSLGNSPYIPKVFGILYEMKKAGIRPNEITLAVLVEVCKKTGSPAKAFRAYLNLKKMDIEVPEKTLRTLLEIFTQKNDTQRGLVIIQEMQQRGIPISIPQKWAQMEKVGEASQSTQQTTTS